MKSFTTEAFTLLGMGISIIALRTSTRISSVGIRGLKLDDYLMLVAAVIYSLETAAVYTVGAWWDGLANNGMTDEERRSLDLTSHEAYLRRGGSKTQLVDWTLYTLLLWMLKTCLAIFYSRLISGLSGLEKRVKLGYILIGATYVATELSIFLSCYPLTNYWQIYPDPGNHCQPAVSNINLYVSVVLNITTDIYLMTIPFPMLCAANLSWKRKLSLSVIFGGGVFVMLAGILRVAIIIRSPIIGAEASGSWAVRETFVAVVIGNAPMIYPAVSHQIDKLRESHLLSRYHFAGSRNSSPPSYPLNPTIGSKRLRGVKSFNALPTTYHEEGSEERIVNIGETSVEDAKAAISAYETSSTQGEIIITTETEIEFRRKEPSIGV